MIKIDKTYKTTNNQIAKSIQYKKMKNMLKCTQLKDLGLIELKGLIESGLFQIQPIKANEILTMQQVMIYLYSSQKQYQINKQKQSREQLWSFVVQLLNNQFGNQLNKNILPVELLSQLNKQDINLNIKPCQNFQTNHQQHEQKHQQQHEEKQSIFNDQLKYLSQQILIKIEQIFPKSYRLIKHQKIQKYSSNHCSKILQLIELQIKDLNKFTDPTEISLIVQKIVLPILFNHPTFTYQCIQLIKNILNYFNKTQQKKNLTQSYLSQIITSFYLIKFQNLSSSIISDELLQQIIAIITAIQTIQCNSQSYDIKLTNSTIFSSHLYRMLLCSNVQSKTANSIAINIYGSVLKQKSLYCHQAQIFITLYSTLRCFGAHLIKDIWYLFYDFIQIYENDLIFTKAQLIDIVFYKIQHHQNSNVVKHCIQSILQQKRSFILFNKVPDAIYTSLMRILNYGMHYLDCLFHMDSKMFIMISKFFSEYFNNQNVCTQPEYQNKMTLFLKSIFDRITFDHALVAILNSFTLIKRKSKAVNKQILLQISALINKNYIRFPIRKRHQMMNAICDLVKNHINPCNGNNEEKQNNNQSSISLSYLIQNCISHFPDDFITLTYLGQHKKYQLLQIIKNNYSHQEINSSLTQFCQNVNQSLLSGKNITQEQLKKSLQNLKFIQLILYLTQQFENQINKKQSKSSLSLSLQTLQSLKYTYTIIYQKYVIQIGESLYKSQTQRETAIKIQKQCFNNNEFFFKYLAINFNTQQFIEKSLTNISLLCKDYIESGQTKLENQDSIEIMKFLTARLFNLIYSFSNSQDKKMEEKGSRIGSQFLQWATDNIRFKQCYLLVIQVLKTRILSIKQFSIQYIEQSIYKIFWASFSVQNNKILPLNEISNSNVILIKQISQISPIYRLRIFTLTSSVLFDDQTQLSKFLIYLLSNISDIADRYDFQNLDEALYLIELVYTCEFQSMREQLTQFYQDSEQTYKKITKLIQSVINTLLQSLNYGIDIKQVITCMDCTLNIIFFFANKYNKFSNQLINLTCKIVTIGEEYWMFQKVLTFKVIQKLTTSLSKNTKLSYVNIFPLLSKILCIQQYRGYDSAIVLENHLNKQTFYTQLKLNLNKLADYQGLTCRLGFIQFLNQLITYSLKDQKNHHHQSSLNHFLQDFFNHCIKQVMKQNKQKMFLTGLHKIRFKHWQTLMAFNQKWIYKYSNKKGSNIIPIQKLIVYCIQMISQNNLLEVKYYLELFLMKLLVNNNSQHIITPEILDNLSEKLVDLISQISKNISFIVISGMTVKHLFKNYKIDKNHRLYPSILKLYNVILSFSCSHVAYFRGLSQYFCLQTVFVYSQYSKILQSTIGQDPDTIMLRNKLNTLIQDYYKQVFTWNVKNNLLKQLPSHNGNIVSNTFYMDRMKKLSEELIRQVKGQVGFLPYKDIWYEAVKSLNLTQNIQIDIEKEQLNQQINQQSIFQRKIDPSLDFIYLSNTKFQGFQMKILITGSKSIPVYGHLSRTGQIFGLSQLIIPYKEIIEDEQYKNVACTAQKWLNIREFSTKKQIQVKQKLQLSLQRELINLKQQGYSFFLLKKHQNLRKQLLQKQLQNIHSQRKIVLIIDQEKHLSLSAQNLITDKICFGKHYSQHVQASIFIWEYFRKIYDEKFRNPELVKKLFTTQNYLIYFN